MSKIPPFAAAADRAREVSDGAGGTIAEVDVYDDDDQLVGTARFHLTAGRVLEVRWSGEPLAGFRAWEVG